MDYHGFLDIGAVVGIGTMIWKLSRAITALSSATDHLAGDVKEIRDNHFPHLQSEVSGLRQDFVRHLEFHAK